MNIDPLLHLYLMSGLAVYSFFKGTGFQFLFVLVIYGAAWQMSEYLSYQNDVSLFLKIFFQNFISIALINLVIKLKYTRFTALFVGLLMINIVNMFALMLLDRFATAKAFDASLGMFNLINVQLMYLDLLALAGVSFDMGSGKTIIRKSFNDHIRSSITALGFMDGAKKSDSLAQEQKQEGNLI